MTRLNVGKLVSTRVLKLTTPPMHGEDVRMWQQFLSIPDTGTFDEYTEGKTRTMQRELGFIGTDIDGKVGPKTIARANVYGLEDDHPTVPENTKPVPTVASLVSLFKQATKYTKANRKVGDIELIVLHSAEIGESMTGAEALANVCADPKARDASWHFAVDADSITQSVLVKDVAWHAPGANANGVGIEMTGRANQTSEQWHDAFSQRLIERTALLAAALCHELKIPPVFVTEGDLVAGKTGITTHALVSKAFKKSDHWDPGPNFPIDSFMSMVKKFLGEEHDTLPSPPPDAES